MALTRPPLSFLNTNSTVFTDPLLVLHQGSSSSDSDVGFVFNRANGLVANVALYWSEADKAFYTTFTNSGGATDANLVPTTYANLVTNVLSANTVSVPSFTTTGNITGGNLITTGTVTVDRLSLSSSQTTVPPLQLTASSLQDGVGALRIDGSQADIFLNPATATHTTVTFAVNNDQRLAFGMDNNSDFYITRRTGGSWYDDTLVIDRDSGQVALGYDLLVSGDATVTGNLTVNGTTTTVSSTNTLVSDSLMELNTGAGSNANDLGFIFERGSTGDNAAIIWDESADAFVLGTTTATGASTGDLTITTGALSIGSLTLGGTAVTSTATELNLLDGVTATTTELNYVDGVTSSIQTQLDGKLSGSALDTLDANVGTIVGTTIPTLDANLGTATTNISTIDSNFDTLDANVGSFQTYANTTLSGKLSLTGGTVSGATTFQNTVNISGGSAVLQIGGASITASAAEINKLDGVTATTTELNYVDGVTSAIQTQLDGKLSGSALDTLDANVGTIVGTTIPTLDANLGTATTNISTIDSNFDTLDANVGSFQTYANTNLSTTTLTVSGDATFDTTTLVIDSTNNRVGINSSSPQQNLQINDSTSPTIRFSRDTSYYWEIGHTSSDFQLNSQTGGTIMHLNYDGNVGIGNTAPASPLTVAGVIESTSGGVKFPDGTTQTSAASGGGITEAQAIEYAIALG